MLVPALIACAKEAVPERRGSIAGPAIDAVSIEIGGLVVVEPPVVEPLVVEPPVVAAPVAVNAAPGVATAITTDGIGPFRAGIKRSERAIRRLVPGLEVRSRSDVSESHDIDEVTVSRAGKPVLTMIMDNYCDADPLFTITTKDPMFTTTTGIAVGATVKKLADRHADLCCKYEEYDPSLDVLRVERRFYCAAGDLPNITFDLDP